MHCIHLYALQCRAFSRPLAVRTEAAAMEGTYNGHSVEYLTTGYLHSLHIMLL